MISRSSSSIPQQSLRRTDRTRRLAAGGPLLLAIVLLLAWGTPANAAVTAQVAANQLVVGGDAANNDITVRVVAGNSARIEVLDGATSVGSFARNTFTSIVVNAVGGNDILRLSHLNGLVTEHATFNGGIGNDTVQFIGTDDHDSLSISANAPPHVVVFQSQRGIILDIDATETLDVDGAGGDDTILATGFPAGVIALAISGGDGNDIIDGSNGNDDLDGGQGDDMILPGPGNDTVDGDSGNDVVTWNAGDGNDHVNGSTGNDRMVFNGISGSDFFTIGPAGEDANVTRVLDASVTLHGVEIIQVDSSRGNDRIIASPGLAALGIVRLELNGGEGADTIVGSDTNDILLGGQDNDDLNGGDGDDRLEPGPGFFDSMAGGKGNDTIVWDADRASFQIAGDDGIDTLLVSGSLAAEVFTLSMQPSGLTLQRDSDGTVNLSTIERIAINGGQGNDTFNVGPDLATVEAITIVGGPGADRILTTASSNVTVNGGSDMDTLEFDPLGQPVSTTPSTIASGGVTRVTHSEVEVVRFPALSDAPPTVTITLPTADPALTATTPFLTLAGSAADNIGLTAVRWSSDRGGSGVAEGATAWTAANIPLASGVNVLTVTARDTGGNTASTTLTVTVNAFTYTMAEGATGPFFDTDILLANPNAVEAPVAITYLKGDGTTVNQSLTLAPTSRRTIAVDQIAGLEATEVSATVTSTAALPLVVERTMRWDQTGYGAHTEKATDGPATTWYFAEGSQGFFDTFVLLANPGSVPSTATVTFLLERGAPLVKTFDLAPTSRHTVQVGAIPELRFQSFGMIVTFTQPGVAERAMYFGTPTFNAGHESAGVNAPATRWFLAEGATGSFFTTFVLLANPGGRDATATITFLPDSGRAITKTKVVPAGQRVTLNIAGEDATLASGSVATAVESTEPILVERAQYWPFTPDRWYEAHNSFGSTGVGTKWGLAEGRVGGPERYQTFILLANANPVDTVQVRITFLRTNGTTVVKAFTVNPTSRLTVLAHSLPELANESFGAVIEVTSGPGIFVERAMYSDANGVAFAAGTNALATRLP